MLLLPVVAGAAAGAPLRYLAGHFLDGRWPTGTLVVNVIGSFLLGLFSGLALSGQEMALLGTGFCGAFTTWSALAVRSVEMGRTRGTVYAVGTIVLAVAAAQGGFAVAG